MCLLSHFPDEERPAARPLRTAPCYDRMKNLGAVFGQKFDGSDLIFLQLMGWSKRMIGHLEDQTGSKLLRKSAKM